MPEEPELNPRWLPMLSRAGALLVACVLACATWIWVQRVAIPHQQVESAVLGIPRGNLSDLYPRWLGTRELLLHHRDPYAPDITREIQAGYYGRPLDARLPNDPRDQQAFAYPLFVVFLLAPTITLPFPLVQKIFLALLILLTAASVLLWFRAIGWRVSMVSRLMWIILVLGSFPAIQGFKLQQLTLLVAALLAGSITAVVNRRFGLAGILLALATIKPQLVLLTVVWLALWTFANWRDRQRLFWSFSISILALAGGAAMVLPSWIQEFLAASADYYRYTGGGKSVLDVALTPIWGRALSLVLIAITMLLLWQKREASEGTPEFSWSLGLALATTLVVIPMFAPYNQLLLLPAAMLIVASIRELWVSGSVLRLLTVAAVASVLWPWFASAMLSLGMPVLSTSTIQKAWAIPLYTSWAIPVTTAALLLVGRRIFASGPNQPRTLR